MDVLNDTSAQITPFRAVYGRVTAVGDGCQLLHSDPTVHLLTYYMHDGHLVANVTCRHGYHFLDDDKTWQLIHCIGTWWSGAVPICVQTSDASKLSARKYVE